jgi:inactivated superfamily I helicase
MVLRIWMATASSVQVTSRRFSRTGAQCRRDKGSARNTRLCAIFDVRSSLHTDPSTAPRWSMWITPSRTLVHPRLLNRFKNALVTWMTWLLRKSG